MHTLPLFALALVVGCGLDPLAKGTGTEDSALPDDGVMVGDILISPASVDFGTVLLDSSQSRQVLLSNTGTTTVSLTSAFLEGDYAFGLTTTAVPVELGAGGELVLDLSFTPTAEQDYTGSLSLLLSGQADFSLIPLAGVGSLTASGDDTGNTGSGAGALDLSDLTVDFGEVDVGTTATRTVSVTNTGDAAVMVTNVVSSASTVISGSIGQPVQISPNSSRTLTISYTPNAETLTTALLSIENDSGATPEITVTGQGVKNCSPCSPIISVISGGSSATNMDQFKATPFDNPNTQSLTVTNIGDLPLEVTGITITNDSNAPAKIICGTDGVYTLVGSSSFTLDAYQSKVVEVQFRYNGTGFACGEVSFSPGENSLTIESNASNGAVSITLGGVYSLF